MRLAAAAILAALTVAPAAQAAVPIPQDEDELAGLDVFSGRVAEPKPVFAPRVTLASHDLPDRVIPPGVSPFQAPGGAYFYIDHKDRAVVSIGRQILVVTVRANSLRRVRSYDLSAVIPADDQLNSALPDWSGRFWFVSRRHGIVGSLDRKSGRVLGTHRTGEAIGNSFAVDDSGGVFVVTDRAQYRYDAKRSGAPKVSWRRRYDNVGIQKPGQFDAGSGTTPTIMGRRYLSIADNAERMQVVVMRRAKRLPREKRRVVCEQPVFRRGAGATENSLIATGRSMIVENNYGYFPSTGSDIQRPHDPAGGGAGRHPA